MRKRVNDDTLRFAVESYTTQIAQHCFLDKIGDLAVMVVIARPRGDGEFVVISGGTVDGKGLPPPVQRKILKTLHNETGVIHAPPPGRS